jgi:hypothetical protein
VLGRGAQAVSHRYWGLFVYRLDKVLLGYGRGELEERCATVRVVRLSSGLPDMLTARVVFGRFPFAGLWDLQYGKLPTRRRICNMQQVSNVANAIKDGETNIEWSLPVAM